jgi:hyaluronan synthase
MSAPTASQTVRAAHSIADAVHVRHAADGLGSSRAGRFWPVILVACLVQGLLLARTISGNALGGVSLESPLAFAGVVFFQLLALWAVGMLAWRLWLVARYRPIASVSDDKLPLLTVVVPAFNEGAQVQKTLRSLANSDYPAGRLHIIAVDDGSADDTWQWMRRAKDELADIVTIIRCPHNRGKRHALYEGFARACGDVIVTVDSDSEVLPDSLRNMVSPFVLDPRVGAVAGNVRVLNQHQGIIPKMLDVSFTYSFEFIRASESQVETVFCTPGAISAYRKSVVEQVKETWLKQTFFGRPANIGEDRAMTNLILKRGYSVKFQENAVVLTEVPTTTKGLSKMFLRWARSNVRESIVILGFAFTRFRSFSATGARVALLFQVVRTVLAALLFGPLLFVVATKPQVLLVIAAVALFSALLPFAIFRASRGGWAGLWAFPYALFSAFVIPWIGPYAFFTCHKSGWLTRQLPKKAPVGEPSGALLQPDG